MDKIVRIYGGLGNQIFQFLYGQYLSKNTGSKIHYYFGVTKSKKADKRDFELRRLFPDISVKSTLTLWLFTKYKIIEYSIRRIGLFSYIFRIVLENEHNGYDDDVMNRGKLFIGYWQNLIALKDQIEIIKKNDWINRFASSLPEEIYRNPVNNSVALHVRRGDYLKLSNIYHRVTQEYYREALGFLRKKHSLEKVFIFSDDIQWCRANLKFDEYDVEFMAKGSIVEDFVAISNCQHKIIANSTFSLLSALLSNHEGQIIAPESWAKGSHDIILPKEIIRIAN